MSHRLLPVLAMLALALPGAARANCSDGPHLVSDGGVAFEPAVEVAFVLDTTGSMSALIGDAKDTIWGIASAMAAARDVPAIRFGLVGYRDRGDAYVTTLTDLTPDIDAVYADLLAFEAGGGGDFPESVNKALFDAVHGLNWSEGCHDLKAIFLVGDAPPQEYPDEPHWPQIVEQARAKGITINTVLAGNNDITKAVWQEIEAASKGRFVAIPVGMRAAAPTTPFDGDIRALNIRLQETVLPYGDRSQQARVEETLAATRGFSAEVAADRATFLGKTAGEGASISGQGDLLQDLKAGAVELGKLVGEQLPKALQGLSPDDQKTKIAELEGERSAITSQLSELAGSREAWLAEWRRTNGKDADAAFNAQITEILKDQAAPYGIAFDEEG